MKTLFAFAASLLVFSAEAQDALLGNPNQAIIGINPSFAGSNGTLRQQTIYRTQWPSLAANVVALYAGVDAYVKPLHGGLAVSARLFDYSRGFVKSSEVNMIYAPHIDLKHIELKVIPSFQVSYLQNRTDVSSWTVPGLVTQQTPIPLAKKNALDFSTGLLLNYKSLYVGGTVFHLNQPDMGMFGKEPLRRRICLNASYNMTVNESTLINFALMYNLQSFVRYAVVSTNIVLFRHLLIGCAYHTGDALFYNVGYRGNKISFTGGYEVVTSRLAGSHLGSYQVAMGLKIPKKTTSATPEYIEKW